MIPSPREHLATQSCRRSMPYFHNFDRTDRFDTLDLPQLLELESETPLDVDLLVRIAIRYLKQYEVVKCHLYLTRALAIDPEDGWTHLYMGNLCNGLGCYDEAVDHFKRALGRLPYVNCPHWCLGDVYAKQGYIRRTEYHYRRAVEMNRSDETARRKLNDWLNRDSA